ncbi:SigB/SigF/SigG family RNA polymerase sigma factor [Mycobacterium sp. WMMD1722]|uniref:SigB/SigF/SigG family RNA polymerase sigma factor n=1 Tax=Mycobacterium sp. WMMD1722 TaxID=3404117 RepID=UPI003BF58288
MDIGAPRVPRNNGFIHRLVRCAARELIRPSTGGEATDVTADSDDTRNIAIWQRLHRRQKPARSPGRQDIELKAHGGVSGLALSAEEITVTIAPDRIDEPSPTTASPPPPNRDSQADSVDVAEIESILAELSRCTSPAQRRHCRRRAITACLPIADHIACRFVGRGQPLDDLIQVARVGLIKAIDRYDEQKGRFLAFAVPTIAGEVRRYFRDATWSIRVPRKVQETHLKSREAFDVLAQRLNRTPTTTELAEELDIDDAVVAESASASSAYSPVSLDAPMGTGDSAAETIGSRYGVDDPHYTLTEDLIVLREAIAELDPRRRAILGMRFFDCLTQGEIARRLGISQVQVCRLLNGTLTRVRDRMNSDVPAMLCFLGPVTTLLW